jgi:diaminohydroxyphosphoribosylaminopyrimidine deaminase/5-amino-6-(5-phosphoribosylamino)uracil reductase
MRAKGIAVEVGLCADQARRDHAGHITRMTQGRPHVMVKLAISADGKAGLPGRKPVPITNETARDRVFQMRAGSDAIVVGIGTVLADDPQLTCRLPGLTGRSPVRIVVDRSLRLPPTLRLLAEARETPTWVIASAAADPARREVLDRQGVDIVAVEPDALGGIDLAAALRALGGKGLTRLLVEGGGGIAAALLRAGLVDRLVWLHAPLLLGGDGIAAVAALGLDDLAAAPRFEPMASERVGGDVMESYRTVTD